VKKHGRKPDRCPAALKHPLARLEELRRTLAGAQNVSAVFLLVPVASTSSAIAYLNGTLFVTDLSNNNDSVTVAPLTKGILKR
jgi:hypothetical protein